MGIKEIDEYLKPREKADNIGIEELEDYELIALLLDTGTKSENVLELSRRYLKEKGGLKGVFLSEYDNLTSYGVKKAKTYRLLAAKEIMRRLPFVKDEKILSAKDAFEKTKSEFLSVDKEMLLTYYLSQDRKILRREKRVSNEQRKVEADSTMIIKNSLNCNCSFVLVIHNHPSGNVNPSIADISLSKDLSSKLQMVGVLLLDSLIVSDKTFLSLRENGYLG